MTYSLSHSQVSLIQYEWGIKKDSINKTIIMPYSTFSYLDGVLKNYIEYRKIVKVYDKKDSVNTSINSNLSAIISNFEKVSINESKNNEILLKENLELKNKVDTFAKQNKWMKKVVYFTAGYFLTKYIIIPEVKTIFNK